DARPLPGIIFKQFTARDVVSRWDVIQAHTRATASTAAQFLETLLHRMPFPIRALQVDGGSIQLLHPNIVHILIVHRVSYGFLTWHEPHGSGSLLVQVNEGGLGTGCICVHHHSAARYREQHVVPTLQ
ncbi:MAG: hypothetical protein DMG96_26865, partial [Acidobacteria bacterium]